MLNQGGALFKPATSPNSPQAYIRDRCLDLQAPLILHSQGTRSQLPASLAGGDSAIDSPSPAAVLPRSVDKAP